MIKSRRMWWAGHVACTGEERGAYRVLVGKPEGKRPLRRPRHRWVDNIRMDLQEVGCGYMDWIGLAQDEDGWRTLVSAVMNLRVPWNAGNFLTNCKPVSCSRRTLHHGVSKYNEHFGVLCRKLDTSESRSEITGKFSNVVLEKDADYQLNHHVRKMKCYKESRRRKISYKQK